ncbi:hypothetical protein SKAU_G00184970 [Synaphobranchus kaupii]|uniref:Uncharacterized protein n=1 Tax=Synaphobranchus kaupii TaxID=118154 RepID=A0A9Q1IWN5_SYNKA|nr:hypothetical protein SKAU_G00184970 [Synaphobranchus kaupii]
MSCSALWGFWSCPRACDRTSRDCPVLIWPPTTRVQSQHATGYVGHEKQRQLTQAKGLAHTRAELKSLSVSSVRDNASAVEIKNALQVTPSPSPPRNATAQLPACIAHEFSAFGSPNPALAFTLQAHAVIPASRGVCLRFGAGCMRRLAPPFTPPGLSRSSQLLYGGIKIPETARRLGGSDLGELWSKLFLIKRHRAHANSIQDARLVCLAAIFSNFSSTQSFWLDFLYRA